MDDKTLKKINEALNIDLLEKVNGGGGMDSIYPQMDPAEVKEYAMKVAEAFGPQVAIDIAVQLGVPRYEAEEWFKTPTEQG